MLIIDAQVHIWGSGKPSDHHRQTSVFTAEELIKEMDEAGVDGAVLHPPSWDAASNEMAIEAAERYPGKFCSLGWFALNDPAQRAEIEQRGEDGAHLHETYIRAFNDAIAITAFNASPTR